MAIATMTVVGVLTTAVGQPRLIDQIDKFRSNLTIGQFLDNADIKFNNLRLGMVVVRDKYVA